MKSLLVALFTLVVLLNAPRASAQDTYLEIGEVAMLAFDFDAPPAAEGRNVAFRVYIGTEKIDPVLGPPTGNTYSLMMPAPKVAGPLPVRVSARWVITDSTKWKCGVPTSDDPTILDCAEQMSDTLNITVLPPTVPPIPTPGNLRIIRTVIETIIDDNGNIQRSSSTTTVIPVPAVKQW